MMAWALGMMPLGVVGAPASTSNLLSELDQLGTTARVLYVAAHPDDENTRLISALTLERNMEVAYLSLTRGSGGQNRIGNEQGDLLGVLRTGELLAARGIDGGRQFFTRARDFGYSKSARETLETWDRERVLDDICAVLREFRPDVVITRFRETGRTHGHHLASAVLARAAVERLEEEGGWRPKRLVLNVPTWRGPAEGVDFEMTVGAWDAVRGATVGEVAARSRSQHRSQGFGMAPSRERRVEPFEHVWGERAADDVLDGVVLGWARFGESGVEPALAAAKRAFRPREPHAMVPELFDARAAVAALSDMPRSSERIEQLERLIVRASGVFVRAATKAPGAAPGAAVELEFEVANRAGVDLRVAAFTPPGGRREPVVSDGRGAVPVAAGEPWRETVKFEVPAGPPTATPWLHPGSVDRETESTFTAPTGPTLDASVELELGERKLTLTVPVRRVWVDRSQGEREARFERLPRVTATPVQSVRLMPKGEAESVTFELVRHGPGPAEVQFTGPEGWKFSPQSVALDRERRSITVRAEPPSPSADPLELVPYVRTEAGRTSAMRLDVVDHSHVERTLALRPSLVRWVPLDLEVPDVRIGYIPGAGDRVADLLAEVGLSVRELTETEVAEADFGGLDVVMTGVRAFNVHPTLKEARERIFDWVNQGGRFVVQYNTNNWFDELDLDLGPGTLRVGSDRVTDETAPVRRLAPDRAVWRDPHRLDETVWTGWIQERGLYFAEAWDDEWTPLIEVADPGEAPLRGALLEKRHGDGWVVYTGLSFFRQLPAGVPGAYRLLVNLLAHE